MGTSERRTVDQVNEDEFLGEMVVSDVSNRLIPIRGIIPNVQKLKEELNIPHIQFIVSEQLDGEKVTYVKNKSEDIFKYVTHNKSAITVGGAVVLGVGAIHLIRNRNR